MKTIDENIAIIDFKEAYPNSPDNYKSILVTSLSEQELQTRYSEILVTHSPYLIIGNDLLEPIKQFEKNNEKFKKRAERNTLTIGFSTDDEKNFKELSTESVEDTLERIADHKLIASTVNNAFRKLTEKQQRRIQLRYIDNLTLDEIAAIENVQKNAIASSLCQAEKKLKKLLEKDCTNGHPLSLYIRGVNQINKKIGGDTNDQDK